MIRYNIQEIYIMKIIIMIKCKRQKKWEASGWRWWESGGGMGKKWIYIYFFIWKWTTKMTFEHSHNDPTRGRFLLLPRLKCLQLHKSILFGVHCRAMNYCILARIGICCFSVDSTSNQWISLDSTPYPLYLAYFYLYGPWKTAHQIRLRPSFPVQSNQCLLRRALYFYFYFFLSIYF